MSHAHRDTRVIAAMLQDLAQACEAHLPGADLAERLQVLASQEASRIAASMSPSQAEAAALAGALSRYLESDDLEAAKSGADNGPGSLRDLAQQVESALATGVRRERASRVAGLYVIIDPELTRGRDVLDVAAAALSGGASALQLRDKVHDKGDQLPVARKLRRLCQEHGASFIVNDHADLAAACGAHGLHVGQHDLPVPEARRVLYPTQFLGTSNALLREAQASIQEQVDYVAVGSMYSTGSKASTRPAGIRGLRQVRDQVSDVPLIAIGGITLENINPVLEAGADGICVIGAVCLAEDPEEAARRLVARIYAGRATVSRGPHASP